MTILMNEFLEITKYIPWTLDVGLIKAHKMETFLLIIENVYSYLGGVFRCLMTILLTLSLDSLKVVYFSFGHIPTFSSLI